MDLGVQRGHVSNQTRIYSIDPNARSRLNMVYMFCYFIGGGLGFLPRRMVLARCGLVGRLWLRDSGPLPRYRGRIHLRKRPHETENIVRLCRRHSSARITTGTESPSSSVSCNRDIRSEIVAP
jgi:hypothetical protein